MRDITRELLTLSINIKGQQSYRSTNNEGEQWAHFVMELTDDEGKKLTEDMALMVASRMER